MSIEDAKRELQWHVVREALAAAGVDDDLVVMVERAKAIEITVHAMARTLTGAADTSQARNYVKVEMVGLIPPFDRAYVELVRPGGKTSHELREMMRDRLEHVKRCLLDPSIDNEAFRRGIIMGIDLDLSKETPIDPK